jgi:uroporphyrinogen decarboxylase
VIAERYLNDVDESSIPRFIRFPVETPDEWKDLKQRYPFDGPARQLNAQAIRDCATAACQGKAVRIGLVGFYGQLRNWMGTENLSLAFYDYPEMVHDMVEHWAELMARQIDRLPREFPIDQVAWWEDMACKNGPLVSPRIFREFLQPGYRRVMQVAHAHGAAISVVDCDGNPHDIVANWLEEGVNIMFPLEVAAGVDPYAWRKEFGTRLLLRGGIAKTPLVAGGSAIDKELERIRPLLEQGGFIPHLDHLVPPDIPLSNYMCYLEKKRKLIGKV